ncbi:MAG: amino acid adenylation domain-containing protein, partial [Acidobacteria bacterium]|nr:amino acid adenylation domain-containing protein [Acidobacteriota bacterium]
EAYRAGKPNPLAPLRVQYADYAQWQRQWLRGEVLEGQLSYWRRQLAGLPPVHGLPLDRPRPARQGFEGGQHVQRLGVEEKARIEAWSRESGVTRFMFLEAAFAVLLGRYSQEMDVVMGSPIAGRVHRDLEPLIGFFVNTLVLRSDLSGNPCFVALLESRKQTILDAYAHQHVPFEMLVEELKPERNLRHSPLFQILFTLESTGQGDGGIGGLRLEWAGEGGGVVRFDLELTVRELEEGLGLSWRYKKELFDPVTIERMAGHFQALLAALVQGVEARPADLPLLHAAEREQMLVEWNDTGAPAGGDLLLHERFELRAGELPQAVALVDGERELTYGELARKTHQLAHHLKALGVGPEKIVGVCLERTAEMVVTLLAVLEAGGAYLPLDPAHPHSRLERSLADSGALVVVTQKSLEERLPWRGPTVILERDRAAIARRSRRRPASGVSRENLAYVLFTSGSTGTPKGVAVTHSSAVELVLWAGRVFSSAELSGVLAATSLSFDLSVFELFAPLSWGGTVILAANALALAELPASSRVRLINTVPSALAELVGAGGLPAGVRTVNLAGEPLSRALADRILAIPTVESLWNLYGPTEDTTYSTFARVERGAVSSPRIGRPITATRAYVVDRQGQPAPVGVAGELWLAGAGLARGYVGRPELTAERFLPDPFSAQPGAWLYRTGDLARWLPEGELEFLGRIDHQVKVCGFRIELGEIEAQLRSQAPVRDAVVLARQDAAGEKRLVAYVVPAEGRAHEGLAGELKGELERTLPGYMIPAVFMALESLPLTANGKVDRGALPAPEARDSRRGEPAAPRTELERRLCEIWQEVLGVERVGIEDGFFDLGGHSLLVIRLVSKVNSQLGIRLSPRRIFEHSTVRALAGVIEGLAGEAPGAWEPLAAFSTDGDARPLYCVPGAGMLSVAMAPLARALARRAALHVFEARGLDGVSPPQTSLAEIVESYGAAIKRRQPQGPYDLVGHSFGGCVALELARWLEARGDEVSSIVLLDSFLDFFATGDLAPLSAKETAVALAALIGIGESEVPDLADDRAIFDWMECALQASGALPASGHEGILRGFIEVFVSQLEMQRRFRPSGRVEAPVTLLYAEEGAMAGSRLAAVLELYARVAERPVRHFAVPGGHLSMLSERNAPRLAARLLAEDR